jgi:ATP-binding cassette subfamily C (CFTR/MRP) protein 1
LTRAGILAVIQQGSLAPSLVGLSLSYALQVTQTLNMVVRQSAEVESNMNAVERTKFYTDFLPQEKADILHENRPPANWPYVCSLFLVYVAQLKVPSD